MRVIIAGGHGKVALRLTRLLRERHDEVRSLIRKPEEKDDVHEVGGDPVVCDLESVSAEELAERVDWAEAVVFAAGAGSGSGPERKWTVDYGAAVKLIEAAKAKGIPRYVMVSSRGADPNKEGDDTFSVYQQAKGKADADLQASGLEYTIVRPTSLTDEPGTGRVEIAEHVEGERIPRDDVAAVLAAALHEPGTVGKTFEVASGDVPVEEAVAAVAAQTWT
jgi:nucleoside-diphosphate-sugar epimerase